MTVSLNKRACWIFIPIATIVSFLACSSCFYLSCFEYDGVMHAENVATVYAGSTDNEAVTSSVACLLHEMGYFVAVYIDSGIHVGGYTVPFSGNREQKSDKFYGECVSQWIPVQKSMSIAPNPKVLIYVNDPQTQLMTETDYRAAKEEIRTCSNQLRRAAKDTLLELIKQ